MPCTSTMASRSCPPTNAASRLQGSSHAVSCATVAWPGLMELVLPQELSNLRRIALSCLRGRGSLCPLVRAVNASEKQRKGPWRMSIKAELAGGEPRKRRFGTARRCPRSVGSGRASWHRRRTPAGRTCSASASSSARPERPTASPPERPPKPAPCPRREDCPVRRCGRPRRQSPPPMSTPSRICSPGLLHQRGSSAHAGRTLCMAAGSAVSRRSLRRGGCLTHALAPPYPWLVGHNPRYASTRACKTVGESNHVRRPRSAVSWHVPRQRAARSKNNIEEKR